MQLLVILYLKMVPILNMSGMLLKKHLLPKLPMKKIPITTKFGMLV